ncbi:MAG: glycosyltransferase family 2 protein [Gammaproteobacteria bacterium]|nr:glycosyltransferase family 2 protein [Gammaproteobacteria bacterium]
MEKLSVFITTFNNAATLETCLESVTWADEIVVLDSFSDDATLKIAERYGCRVFQHEFQGYGPQKQMALEKTSHAWVLLLDADEALSPEAQDEIRRLLEAGPQADGYTMPRREQMFWQFAHPATRMNRYLRLFDKRKGSMDDMPVHAAPRVNGTIGRLESCFVHYGEPDVHTKVEKINAYSSGLAEHKAERGNRANPWPMVFYPPFFFIRIYILKRNFVNGWAGFIASVVSAFYAFLKYAKRYEHQRKLGRLRKPDRATEEAANEPP